MPFQIEDYVHRVGRTARAGQSGTAYSFFTKKNFMVAPDLVKVLQQQVDKSIEIPPALRQLAFMALKASTGANEAIFKRRWRKIAGDQDATDTTPQRPKKATVNIEDVIRAKQEKLAAEAAKKAESAD